ncbi:ATP adenylyltransferase-domain-containing protein [Trametes gibbosa]|nr:ATP adenylyltransferase-domain-containing protein [Trametes gibbosa]
MLPIARRHHCLHTRAHCDLTRRQIQYNSSLAARTTRLAPSSPTTPAQASTRTHARSPTAAPTGARTSTLSIRRAASALAPSTSESALEATSDSTFTSGIGPAGSTMTGTMHAQDAILAKLPAAFDTARASGDLLFFPSTVHTHAEHGVEFEIRLCPALQDKPPLPTPDFSADADAAPAERQEEEKKRPDPFAPPYVPNLYLGEVRDEADGDEYVILFNKYSVVPHHILMVTKEFRSQTAPLIPPDLVQAYLFLIAAQKAGRRFFVFYNCGDLSGASQPHKHLQLIPIEDDGPPVERLARAAQLENEHRPFSLGSLPYANHVRRLPPSLPTAPPSALEPALAHAFLALLDLAIGTVRRAAPAGYPRGPPSYNVVLTLEHMHVVPRAREAHTLAGTGEALSVNALGFAGMLLVKSARELEAVRREGVGAVLRGVGMEGGGEE